MRRETNRDGATGRDDGRSTTRRKVLQGLAAAGTASLAGCASAVSLGSGRSTVRYAQVLPPVTLDPLRIDDVWSAQAAGRVFQGLYTFGSGTEVVPRLAAGKPKVDETGTTVTVDVRPEARFQNGDAVTAADVKYSLRRPVEGDLPPKWALEPIEEIRMPDDRTVELHLSRPYPTLEYALTQPIVPKEAREANPKKFATEPVGSGPFEATLVKEGKYAVLEKWSGYWGETTPAVDRVKFVGNHSGLARSTSLRTGQNDVVERVQPKLWSITEGFPHAEVRTAKSYHYFYVGFNCNDGPTAKREVREAIDHLLDVDELVEHFVDPTKQGDDPDRNVVGRRNGDDSEWRQCSPLPESLAREWKLPVEKWQEIPHRKNPEEAKRLIEDAGVRNWQPKVAVPKDMLREKFADAIVHELSNIGFKRARTVKYDWKEYREKLEAGSPSDYHMFVGSWGGYPDPDAFCYPLFHENAEGLTNFTFYQNEEVMERLSHARETTKREKRRPLYEQAITTLLEDRVHLPAFTLHNTFGVSGALKGFDPHPIASVNPRFVGPNGAVSLSD